jgi:ATPase family AAA domain-containing protein 3A/B
MLDEAVQDRIDEMVLFDRPSVKERINLLYHYLILYCEAPKSWKEKVNLWKKHPSSMIYKKKEINISNIQPEYIEEVAIKTEGFSGREITKLVVSWHDAAFAKDEPILDQETMDKVLDIHLKQNKTKNKWNTEQSDYFKVMHPKI